MIWALLIYIVGAVLVSLVIDYSRQQNPEAWTDREHAATALFWPLALVAFVSGYIMIKLTGTKLDE